MAQFNISAMKAQAKATLLANGWETKSYDNDGNLVSSGHISEQGEILIDAICDAFITQFEIWKLSQVVSSPVQVNTISGTGATIPTPGSLP